jgi:hypothetical protein
MTKSTTSHRALGHRPFTAAPLDELTPAGPRPGMSRRAALIARSIAVTLLVSWLALTEPRLVAVLAIALPFWIAVEIDALRGQGRAAPAPRPNNVLRLLAREERRSRTSQPPTHEAA